MRKKIIIAAGFALWLAGVVSAQQQGERGERPRRDRGAALDSARGPRDVRGRGGPDGLLLKGITLTEGQRAQIAQLNRTQRDAFEKMREQRRIEMEQVRTARQRGDTAAVRAAMEKSRATMNQARTQHIAAIRNLLTVEQRVQFDANVATLRQREARQQGFGARGEASRGKGQRGHGQRSKGER